MRIKQHGNPKPWQLDVTCENCKAVITLEKANDLFADTKPTGKMDGPYLKYWFKTFYFECPECGKVNEVASQCIRMDIKEQIMFKKK